MFSNWHWWSLIFCFCFISLYFIILKDSFVTWFCICMCFSFTRESATEIPFLIATKKTYNLSYFSRMAIKFRINVRCRQNTHFKVAFSSTNIDFYGIPIVNVLRSVNTYQVLYWLIQHQRLQYYCLLGSALSNSHCPVNSNTLTRRNSRASN